MRAASWDITWEVGSPWKAHLRRRDRTNAPLPLTEPCLLQVRRIDEPSSATPQIVVTGTLDDTDETDPFWVLGASAAQTRTLGPGRFQHVLLIGEAGATDPNIWARGYVRARDKVGDQ